MLQRTKCDAQTKLRFPFSGTDLPFDRGHFAGGRFDYAAGQDQQVQYRSVRLLEEVHDRRHHRTDQHGAISDKRHSRSPIVPRHLKAEPFTINLDELHLIVFLKQIFFVHGTGLLNGLRHNQM